MKRLNIRSWSKRKKIITATLLLLAVAGMVFVLTRDKTADSVEEITQPDKKYYSQLTGLEVDKDESEESILGVMIENSEEARPQSGLDSAGIVFETVTEGGITRYLLLFQENKPEELGPVRSVRPAFVDWAMGFDASIAHVGGSEQALQMIEDRGGEDAKDMNEFFHAESFFRNPSREAPHDAYAKSAALVELQKQLQHETSKFDEIQRSEGTANPTPTATTITLQFSDPIFGASFTFDAATNSYTRSLGGIPHLDANTNAPITVKNLIVFKQDIQSGSTGKGKASLYKDGVSQEINWEQTSYTSRIKFTDSTGGEVALNRGDTWIAVLPPEGSVTVK